MKWSHASFANFDSDKQIIFILSLVLPPPLSLDTLCFLSEISPLKTLNIAEGLVKSKYLSKCSDIGPGVYSLADFHGARIFIEKLPQELLFDVAGKAVEKIMVDKGDTPKEWLSIAHIHDVSGLPLKHFREVILAGSYCKEQKLPMDAATYYLLALTSMESAELSAEEQSLFVDGVINICASQKDALSLLMQKRCLNRALSFIQHLNDPEKEIQLNVLLAGSLAKKGKSTEAASQFEKAWQILNTHELPKELRLKVALAYADFLFFQGLIDEAIKRYEAVIDNHEEVPSERELLKSYAVQGWIYGVAGETARGLGLAEAVFAKAQSINAPEIEVYAMMVKVLILVEARLISETELHVKRLFAFDAIYLDPYIQRVGYAVKAFIAYWHGDYDKAFRFQDEAYKEALKIENDHHRGSVNFEYMVGLEERGMRHPHWNFDSEVERLSLWSDIKMKGAALRYRALRAYKKNEPVAKVKADLLESITLLERGGAKIELAQSRVLLARVLIGNKEEAEARELLKSSWEIFSKINPELLPQELKPYLSPDSKRAMWMDSLLSVGEALGTIRERNLLLSEIVCQAIRIVAVERGAIFLKKGNKIEIAASRNMESHQIFSSEFSQQMEFLESVLESGKECIKKEVTLTMSKNGSPTGAGWIGCFPIRLKARIIGVIYLDCKLVRMDLSEDEIRLLRILSNQAAVALDNLEAYENISNQKDNLEIQANYFRQSCTDNIALNNMIGSSRPFQELVNNIEQVAASDSTVMITGETGVGKELVAQAIHRHSSRAQGPFIAVNLASLGPELIASELFGHEKGAFTGAIQSRQGRFELASKGTLFLDDIDTFSLDIQAKMLRVLEAREFERVGGNQTLKTRFRLVAASNKRIEDLVKKGLFRSDFYYRLNVFPIRVPPLRERREDIPALVHHFMDIFQRKTDKQFRGISKESMQRLLHYQWPGNVRELRHVIERSILMSNGEYLHVPPLEEHELQPNTGGKRVLTLKEMEIEHITSVLKMTQGRISGAAGAAEILDLKPSTLYAKVRRFGLERGDYKPKKL